MQPGLLLLDPFSLYAVYYPILRFDLGETMANLASEALGFYFPWLLCLAEAFVKVMALVVLVGDVNLDLEAVKD